MLSYDWGCEKPTEIVEIDGYSIAIRPNLVSMLRHLRSNLGCEYLWVDELCINQTDAEEVKHHVKMMGRIHEKASKNLLWLDSDVNENESNLGRPSDWDQKTSNCGFCGMQRGERFFDEYEDLLRTLINHRDLNVHYRDRARDFREHICWKPEKSSGMTGSWDDNKDQTYDRKKRPGILWNKINAGLNIGSAVGMGGTFIALNGNMNPYPPSMAMNWITNAVAQHIPSTRHNILLAIPDWVLFANFSVSTTIFVGSTFVWVLRCSGKDIALSSIVSGLSVLISLAMDFNDEELILIFVPLSISFGILASCSE